MIQIPRVAAVHFGQAVELEERCGVEKRTGQAVHVVVQAIPHEAERERALFNRPHTPTVITEWVVRRVIRGERADAPAAEQVRGEQAVCDERRPVAVDDPAHCGDALDQALRHPGPVVVEAVIDPYEPPMPPKITFDQAKKFAQSLARGEPNREKIALTVLADRVRELV